MQFNAKEGSSSKPLELIHTDICGPVKKNSPRGEQYYILFIDDFSRMCWIGLIKHKDEAFEKFQIFKALVENELDLKFKCVIKEHKWCLVQKNVWFVILIQVKSL